MPSEKVARVAEQILDDLDGAAYYADPKILAGILKSDLGTPEKAEQVAGRILTDLLRRYARSALQQANRHEELNHLASLLEGYGLR
jgi:hypothetical protein